MTSQSSFISLKAAQLNAVNRMLAFNQDVATEDDGDGYTLPPAGSAHNQWKVLIYDAPCRSIISPLLNVQQLRKRGVTLHLMLESHREPIPDVPAVYFCAPTQKNLAIIAKDCASSLYDRAHLNFSKKLDRSLMEEFCQLVVQTGSLEAIASVHDQYLDFACLENSLFSLAKKDSYVIYNGSGTSDQAMEEAMTEIAQGLFSVVATLGVVPIIRCPKNGAPEMVARKLNRMIAEHPTLLQKKSSSRPLLVIMDRNADLITPIQHPATYQAIIDDLLPHKANRVECLITKDGSTKKEKYDLDPDEDAFLSQHKFQPFPEAINANAEELDEVARKQKEITAHGDGEADELASKVDSLPVLLERKKQLEMHTNILRAAMDEIRARDIVDFFDVETDIATGIYRKDPEQAKRVVLDLIAGDSPKKGSIEDKIRLLLVYGLATTAKSADMDQVAKAMQESLQAASQKEGGPVFDKAAQQKLQEGLRAVQYIKQLQSMHMLPTMATMEAETNQAGGADMLSSFMNRATIHATGLLAKATAKMGAMLSKTHKHVATQVVENLCEFKLNSEDQEYLYLDPKVKGDVDVHQLPATTRAPVRNVILFMVGGGCYSEYQNLQMLATERRSICYGSTEVVNPSEFLGQLAKLG